MNDNALRREGRGAVLVWAVLLTVGALVVRLAWVLSVDSTPPAFSDPQWYFATAKNVANGNGFTIVKGPFGTVAGEGGFQTLRWPVGYSLSLAVPFKLFGASLTTAKVLNAIAGALLVPLTLLIGRRAFSMNVGIVAAILMALYPAHIIWSSVIYSDVLFAVPFAAALALTMHTPTPASADRSLIIGILIGYAGIIRPTGLVLIVAIACYWLLRSNLKATVRAALPLVVGTLLIAAPVSLWNTVRTDSPKLLSENLGYNLRIGHAPYATGRYVTPEDLWATVDTQVDPSAIPSESLAIRKAVGYAIRHPVEEVGLSGKKVFYLYTTDSDAVLWASTFGDTPIWGSMATTRRLSDLADAISWMVILLSLASLPRTLTLRKEMLLLWLVLAVWTITHVVFFGEPRYRLPILPILLSFAAVSIVEIAGLIKDAFGGSQQQDSASKEAPNEARQTGLGE